MKALRFFTHCLTGSAVPYAFVLALVMVGAAWVRTGGEFTYPLDDPYIHMTLARNILHGNYGINMGEFASPSSSILWPFLLAPFAGFSFFIWVPLIINIVCFVCTAQLLYAFVKRDVPGPMAIVVVTMLTLAFNLLTIMMTGMEHSLQVMLVVIVALEILKERPNPLLFYPAVIVLPLVRYEDLAISMPALVYCYWRGMRRGPVVAAIVIIAAVSGFSLFLRSLGLDYLPSSVLAKLDAPQLQSRSSVLWNTWLNFRSNSWHMFFNTLIVVCVAAIFFWLRGKARQIALLLIVPTVAIYAFGKHGFFDRYQIHILIYGFLMSWELLRNLPIADHFRARVCLPLAVVLVLANFGFVVDMYNAPLASKNTHDQQYQLASLERDFLKEPVAVNDLGMVSYYGHQPVLDLWGLGSVDALRARVADPSGGWIGPIAQRKGVEFAFIYESWFPRLPASWVKVGTLTLPDQRITPACETVELFATNEAAASRLRVAFDHYRSSSPLAQRISSKP
jgi:hypothetical protein